MQDSSMQKSVTVASMEKRLSILLLAGVLLSFSLVTLGAILEVVKNGQIPVDFHQPARQPLGLDSLQLLLRDALDLRPRAVIMLGVLTLVSTPILRIIAAIFLFCKKGDYLYVGITLLVLTIVLISLVFSLGGTH